MATSTKRKARPVGGHQGGPLPEGARPVPPEGPGAGVPVEQEPERETQWASADDLGRDADFEDVTLPALGRKVRVRYLDQLEVARLQRLPDVAQYAKMVLRLRAEVEAGSKGEEVAEADRVDSVEFAAEHAGYMALLVHAAVAHPQKPYRPEKCRDCRLEHPPMLWTRRQAARLRQSDIDTILRVALQLGEVEALAPFSQGPTQDATPPSAASGGSTPPTS